MFSVHFAIYASYLLSGGFKNYKKYCTGHIEKIETYNKIYGSFPTSLSKLDEPRNLFGRYNLAGCGYNVKADGYSFYTQHGLLGVAIYESSIKVWVYDQLSCLGEFYA